MIEPRIYTDDSARWDAYVSAHPDATNYHQFGWKEVIEKSFGHATYYLSCEDEQGRICGILPLVRMKSRLFGDFIVSLPFLNYGGILCDSPHIEACLIDAAEKVLKETGTSSIELRHIALPHGNLPTKTSKVTMIMDLAEDDEHQWKAFNAKLRNQIRKAEKCELRVVIGGMELLDGFYEVFCRNMRDLGTPVYGNNFFRNVLNIFPQSTKIISVFHNDTVIASGIASWFRDTLEIPWASSIREYKAMCPNNLLYWEAIKFGIGRRFAKLDFGRSTPNEGTYKFKEQWGARPVQLHWQYLLGANESLPELNTKNPKYQMAIALWQKLPVGVTKILGPRIVRSIP